jgi:hypothetical protein
MTENYKKLSTKEKILYGLSLLGLLGTLGLISSFAHKFNDTVKSLPTKVVETFETNYTITQICGTGASTTRETLYTENLQQCEGESGARTCTIEGKVMSGILSNSLSEATNGGPTVQIDGELCSFSSIAEKLLWQRTDEDSAFQISQ